jgi:solute carrier family 45 protein 1/2/4
MPLNDLSAWLGWFPVLFYTTVYVGELHKRASPVPDPSDIAAVHALETEATRLGSRALLYSSLVSLAANVVLPFFVSESINRLPALSPLLANRTWAERCQVHLSSLWALSHLVFALCMGATL